MHSSYYIFNMKFLQGLYNEGVIYRNVAVGYSAVMVLRFGLLFTMLLYISHRLQKEALELHAKELCYLCLIPIAGILFGNFIFRLFFTVKENVFFQLYEQYPVFIGLVPLTSVLFYAGIVITIMSYQEMVKLQEEKKKYFAEEQQLRAIRERMGEVEQFYDGIRRMKHEMKNHLTNIKGLAGSGSYEEMEQYIAKMDESLDAFELTIRTGNAVTDVIVNDKQKAAEKQGIKFSSEFLYPVSDGYDAYDIAIIINNLLQNALEACEKMEGGKRYISLSGRQKKRFFLICVKNSFEGEVAFDKNNNLPVYTNGADLLGKPASMHGIGLSNVKRETAKYLGNVDIRIKKRVHRNSIVMSESISINISEAGFEAMKNDPEYEAWVLNDLRTGWAQADRWAGVCGGAYSTIYYGATKEECHAEMWSAGYQNGSGKSLFDSRAKDSFWERRVERKKQMEAQIEEQQEKKRMQEEANAKVAMEKSDAHRRLMAQWAKEAVYSDSVLVKSGTAATANATYEANFVMADNGLI